MATNKEVYHEGWLIKSPPTKRIWRARWRRRWFTLKQSDVPGQFFLEYYTDRKCRKLKGTIDLDQCEQVDAGLRLDRQKEKYAHMFDVKTPTRTYYLAADTEDDMRGWVNCICQVCNLQETQTVDDRPYYNIGAINMMNDAVNMAVETRPPARANGGGSSTTETDISNETETTMLNHSVPAGESAADQQQQQQASLQGRAFSNNNPYGTYQNEEMMGMRSAHGDYTNRETIICEAKLNLSHQQPSASNIIAPPEAYSNLDVIERSQSLRGKPGTASSAANGNGGTTSTATTTGSPLVNHMRTQSLNIEQRGTKRIPENLKLTDRSPSSAFDSGPEQPSPALSTSSGPYIPISECYSGSPVTPLNSLDPRFYETPRSHTNVGFNLVSNEQPYSPKRSNVGGGQAAGHPGPSSLVMAGQQKVVIPGSGKSSPSDSESVFTDDEWTAPAGSSNGVGAGAGGAGGGSGTVSRGAGNGGTIDRNARPSDSSIENDAVGWTYVQRFSKIPNSSEDKPQQHSSPKVAGNGTAGAPPRPPKRASMNLEGIEKTKDLIASDTENVSPAIIGPKDASSCIDEFYDIPRSHQHPYTGSSMHLPDGDLLSPLSHCDLVASSTPNLIGEFTTGGGGGGGTLGRGGPRPHCYTNAAPTKVEGNVFRFDFSEQQPDAPIINRRLKPRSSIDITKSIESITQGVKQLGGPTTVPAAPPATPSVAIVGQQPSVPTVKSPPTIDRTRKPATPKIGTNSMRRKGGPVALNLASNQSPECTYGNTQETNASAALLSNVSPRAPGKNEDRLQYLDLDHSNSPQKSSTATSSGPYSLTGLTGIGYGGVPVNHHHHHGSVAGLTAGKSEPAGAGGSGVPTVPGAVGSGSGRVVDVPAPITSRTPYTTVDFVKTDAFNRIREDSELTRSKARQKDQAS